MKGKLSISRPSFGCGKKVISISVCDDLSCIEFLELEIKLDEFAECITGLGRVECDMEVRGLQNVGKKRETKELVFEMPSCGHSDRKKVAAERAALEAGEGWTASNYFGSQGSFFTSDGKSFARTHAYRWVEVDAP